MIIVTLTPPLSRGALVHVVCVRISRFLDLVQVLYNQIMKAGLQTRKGELRSTVTYWCKVRVL